jgi:hypothetical protein
LKHYYYPTCYLSDLKGGTYRFITFIPPHHLYHQHLQLRLKHLLYPTTIVFKTLLLPHLPLSLTPREVPINVWHPQDS